MTALIIGVLLLFFILVLSLRYKSRMAGLLGWVYSSLFGAQNLRPEGNKEPKQLPTTKESVSKSKTAKVHQKTKKQGQNESKPSTKLSKPIKDVIKESDKEEVKAKIQQPSTSKKKERPLKNQENKQGDSSKSVKDSNIKKKEEDDIGYSFFTPRTSELLKNNSETAQKKKAILDLSDIDLQPWDDIGYSFLPVKDKTRKDKSKTSPEKNSSKEKLNTVIELSSKKTKETVSKPSIIDHYKPKAKKEAVITQTVPTVTKKFVTSLEKVQSFVVDNTLEEKLGLENSKPENKASKKVCSTISYANVLSNTIPKEEHQVQEAKLESREVKGEVINVEEISDVEEQSGLDINNCSPELNSPDKEIEVCNTSSEELELSRRKRFSDIEKELVANVIESTKLLQIPIDLGLPKFSKSESNSSSIEVISDYQSISEHNIDYQDINLDPLGKAEENIAEENKPEEIKANSDATSNKNLLISSDSDFEQFIHKEFVDSIFLPKTTFEEDESEIQVLQIEPGYVNLFQSDTSSPLTKTEEDNLCVDDILCVSEYPIEEKQTTDSLNEEEFTIIQDVSSHPEEVRLSAEEQSHKESSFPEKLPEQSLLEFEHIPTQEKNCDFSVSTDFLITESVSGITIIEKNLQLNHNLVSEESSSDAVKDQDFNIFDKVPKDIESEEETVAVEKFSKRKENIVEYVNNIENFESSYKNNLNIDNESDLGLDSLEESNNSSNLIEDINSSRESYKAEIECSIQDPVELNHIEKVTEKEFVKEYSYITDISKFHSKTSLNVPSENKASNMSTTQEIRVLTLNNQEHQECTIYRLEKNWIIQFRLGPSLFGRKVSLYCNYPVEKNGKLVDFERNQYQLLNWLLDEGCKNADDTAAYTQIVANLSGSFHYYFTFENGVNAERQGSGFFLVDPTLKFGNDEELPLDCIQCQTVLTKGLGSFSTWEKKLQVAKESGYNMIHFTPIQELGESNSSYSLSEQLKLNPVFRKESGEMPTFDEVEKFVSKIRRDWKVTAVCDIVLNHTANESQWIKQHPEVTYNCVNCPYMRPAYLLDAAFHQFSLDVKKGLYEDRGIPAEINTEEHLNAIRYHFPISVLEPLNIPELYICDVNKCVAEFLNLARTVPPVTFDFKNNPEPLNLIQDPEYRRLAGKVNIELALKQFNVYRNDTYDEESRLKRCAEAFKNKLDSLNDAVIEEINGHLSSAIENVIASIRYFRVQSDGPRVKEITKKNPLLYRYFTDYGTPKTLKEHEDIMYSNNGRFLMAHNGWVMNSDPLKNFAAPGSNVYIRRELIAWGDSVKLRFGDGPEDCPFLWDYMRQYVEQTAKIFDGVRLDNCHSTPIPVAEYLLDCARRVRPNLYVVAELFTNSDMTDNIFVNRLGITSLIREAMSAWDSHEEGRLVYRYGGCPVGSFHQLSSRPLVPSVAHALFLDLTHDNPSPVEKRSVFDLLPSTALINMACCASGSNRGYDELVPHHIHVVDETREYTEWTNDENLAIGNSRYVTKKSGIIAAKKAINDLHFLLGKEGYNQVYVDQMDPDIVAVTRHCPENHQSYVLVAFTAFGMPNEDADKYQRGIKPLRVEGVLEEIVLEATLSHMSVKTGGSKYAKWEKFLQDSKWINGLSEYQVSLKEHIQVAESDVFEEVNSGTPNVFQLNFRNFKPGSIVVVKVSLPKIMSDAIKTVHTLTSQFSITRETDLSKIVNKLTLADLNRAIYRCDQEERDEGFGFDVYNIPNFSSTVYTGFQGFMSLLANIRPSNDLGHPMCANLRDGNWMIEYIWKRLEVDEGTKELGQWIEENTKCFNNIPRYLVPCYFDMVITGIYIMLIEQSYKLMSNFVNHGSTFVRGLSLGSVQFAALIKSADLPTLSPNLAPPKPPTRKNEQGEIVQACVTLSAGLPHFSVGYMRNWGRDTFISLRGLFILTGRYEEARQHILGYAACLRHGLIPNLLDGGRNPRFNCRDAVWWWLYCVKEYTELVPNGLNILSDKVSRIFPTDASPPQPPGAVEQDLSDVIQEALTVHFQGLAFRERNAGRQIDEHMTDRGFNNQIGIHPETGFVFGGNEWNCGTWMDKMGSSEKAGNRGKPATPRDGSAVELIGLSKAVVTWLDKLSKENKYPHLGVERSKHGVTTRWTFKEWSNKIQNSFEKYFWVNSEPVEGEIRPDLINKRGIYKDCYGATQNWTDFQLRCNFPIAMVVAPELFTPKQAWIALQQAEKYLLGPLGMKTLDPEDWAYRGDYDNSNDSNDPTVANGFNYHQGPEWVWPVGFFLRAKLHFAAENNVLKETLASTKLILSKHFTELQSSPWRGLPELTNSNGSYCHDSSRTQAWSMACVLEVLHDLQKIESSQTIVVN